MKGEEGKKEKILRVQALSLTATCRETLSSPLTHCPARAPSLPHGPRPLPTYTHEP